MHCSTEIIEFHSSEFTGWRYSTIQGSTQRIFGGRSGAAEIQTEFVLIAGNENIDFSIRTEVIHI